MIDPQAALRFRRLGLWTICAVYFVIFVGSSVRASGAGMGCPDWPTCFGQWIPPTDVSQLPVNYHEIYAQRGYQNTDFNPLKTWTEYANRLVGVTIGGLVLLTAWSSRLYLNADRRIFYLAMTVLGLVGFQAWLGSAVVASNLKPLIITLHMLLAMVIVMLLIYAISRSQRQILGQFDFNRLPSSAYTMINVLIGMTLLQIAMGTQVREAVDFLSQAFHGADRQHWRDNFPIIFYVHRSFSSLILFSNLWLSWRIYSAIEAGQPLRRAAVGLSAAIITAILAGVVLDRLEVPPFAQPIHLLMANLILGQQFFILLCFRAARQNTLISA
jgi:cytochrome c oxidase assembly protein subunit 15